MATGYTQAPDVERIARDVIRKHHHHLLSVDIRYVFRSKASKKGTTTVLGKAKKMTGLNAWLATGGETDDREVPLAFFLIEIAADTWEELSPSQQEALVDHELCHCAVDFGDDGEPRLSVRSHDLEEFRAIVARHGLWKPDVAEFASAVKSQMSLLEPDDRPVPRMDEVRLVLNREEAPEMSEGAVPAALSDPTTIVEELDDDPAAEAVAVREEPTMEQLDDGEQVATVDELDDVERIAPEPVPAVPDGPRSTNGPRVAHFNVDDVAEFPRPSEPVERTPLRDRSAGRRDQALASFLNE